MAISKACKVNGAGCYQFASSDAGGCTAQQIGGTPLSPPQASHTMVIHTRHWKESDWQTHIAALLSRQCLKGSAQTTVVACCVEQLGNNYR